MRVALRSGCCCWAVLQMGCTCAVCTCLGGQQHAGSNTAHSNLPCIHQVPDHPMRPGRCMALHSPALTAAGAARSLLHHHGHRAPLPLAEDGLRQNNRSHSGFSDSVHQHKAGLRSSAKAGKPSRDHHLKCGTAQQAATQQTAPQERLARGGCCISALPSHSTVVWCRDAQGASGGPVWSPPTPPQ